MSKADRLSVLRRERRGWSLTQKDLAHLVGFQTAEQCSRLERERQLPLAETMLACLILFDTSADALFPRFYAEIEEKVLRRANALYEELKAATDIKTLRKRALLEQLLQRAVKRQK